MRATQEYINAIYEIQSATLDQKVKWVRNRPDSFKYIVMNEDLEDLILTFQRVETDISEDFYLSLIKKNFETSEILLSIDTSNHDKELKNALMELYSTIDYQVDLQNLSGLNDFIDIVKSGTSKTSMFDVNPDPVRKNGADNHD